MEMKFPVSYIESCDNFRYIARINLFRFDIEFYYFTGNING